MGTAIVFWLHGSISKSALSSHGMCGSAPRCNAELYQVVHGAGCLPFALTILTNVLDGKSQLGLSLGSLLGFLGCPLD